MVKKENPLKQLPSNIEERGEIKIHLKEIMEKKGVSLNQLSFRTEMQRKQLRNYRDGKGYGSIRGKLLSLWQYSS